MSDAQRFLAHHRNPVCAGAFIALALSGCAFQASDPRVPPSPPLIDIAPFEEPKAEDTDPLSQAITESIAALLASDMVDRDTVTDILGVKWSPSTEDSLAGGIYHSSGAADLPFAKINYERWTIKTPYQARLEMQLMQNHCYDSRALEFNHAPGHVATPHITVDGDQAGIVGRSYFMANDTKVFLAYRQESSGRRCVNDVRLMQLANWQAGS